MLTVLAFRVAFLLAAAGGGEARPATPPSVSGRPSAPQPDAGAPPPAGSIFARDSALPPDAGAPVEGSLDKAIIQGIIQRHVNEVKGCYELGLGRRPDLFGTIEVEFTIGASGTVIKSVQQSSTMGDPQVEGCVVESPRRWQFPKPLDGGLVIVTYPFVFTSDEPFQVAPGTKAAGPVEIDVFDIEGGAFVHQSMNAQGVPSNGLIAVTDKGLLLVDTAWTDEQTEAVLKWGETRLKKRWIGAVITHDHADRDGGLGALRKRKIPVAAVDLTVKKLAQRHVKGIETLFAAKAGAFEDPRGFQAFYPGPGHTTDNIVLKFPSLLYGGCLVKAADAPDLGFTGDADLAAWPEALRRVAARYGKTPVVPGHGVPDQVGDSIPHTLDLLARAAAARPAPQPLWLRPR
jgi:metallo-beta-lactamase class B